MEKKPKVLLLPASRDEVVPPKEVKKLEKLSNDLEFEGKRKDVLSTLLHNKSTVRRDGQQAVAKFIVAVAGRWLEIVYARRFTGISILLSPLFTLLLSRPRQSLLP